jgi:hypothetical protein
MRMAEDGRPGQATENSGLRTESSILFAILRQPSLGLVTLHQRFNG